MDNEKIEKLILKMIADQDQINFVEKSTDPFSNGLEEYYFTFPFGRYSWSICQNPEGDYSIFYYPSQSDKSVFLRFGSDSLGVFGEENLTKLYKIIKEKQFGFDKVLDNILTDF